jgi:hypothetical protein
MELNGIKWKLRNTEATDVTNVIPCDIVTSIQTNRLLNRFLRANQLNSTNSGFDHPGGGIPTGWH